MTNNKFIVEFLLSNKLLNNLLTPHLVPFIKFCRQYYTKSESLSQLSKTINLKLTCILKKLFLSKKF